METFGLSTLLDCHGRNFLASHYFSEYLYLKRLYENAHNYIISGYNLLASNWLPSMPDLMERLQFQEGIVVAGGYYNGITTMFMPFHG